MKNNYRKKFLIAIAFVLVIKIGLKSQVADTAIFQYSNGTCVIDGFAEPIWDTLAENAITYLIDGDIYPDSLDCSGFFKAFWHEDSLFIFAQAIDDSISDESANEWENDGFEIYFDLDNSKDDQFTNDCYQFRFNVKSSNITGRVGINTWVPPTVDFSLVVNNNIRTLEVVFPLIELGFKGQINNQLMGFDLQILDNDGDGREAALAWHDNEHHAWDIPAMMGTIMFSNGQEPEAIDTIDTTDGIQLVNDINLIIYPNPATSNFTIKAEESIKQISIYSIDGKSVFNSIYGNTKNVNINVSGIVDGLFLLYIEMNNNLLIKKKLIIN